MLPIAKRISICLGVSSVTAIAVLSHLERVVQPLDAELYEDMRQPALLRIAIRDADDWPVLACAMTLGCPVWTEDADFFGSGIPTWTTDRIELYFA
jgi:predicted nucleic acid-binding protein